MQNICSELTEWFEAGLVSLATSLLLNPVCLKDFGGIGWREFVFLKTRLPCGCIARDHGTIFVLNIILFIKMHIFHMQIKYINHTCFYILLTFVGGR